MDEFNFAAAFDTKTPAERGFEFQLNDMHGRPTPIWIRVLGADSDQYKRIDRAQNRKRNDRFWRSGARQTATIEEQEADRVERLAAVTVGWRVEDGRNVVMPDGQPFPRFSLAAVKSIYTLYSDIADQVQIAVLNRANFSQGSETS